MTYDRAAYLLAMAIVQSDAAKDPELFAAAEVVLERCRNLPGQERRLVMYGGGL